MSTAPQLIVEFPHVEVPDPESARSVVAAARATAAVAASRSVPLLLPEAPDGGGPGLDPGILAGILSADRREAAVRGPVIRSAGAPPWLIVTARTSRNAPYNLARRIQSLNRTTCGQVGLFLRADGLDPVTSDASPGLAAPGNPSLLLGEYVEVLRRLWASFPEEALIGHREAGRFADPRSLAPASFAGEVYSVAGALNVPLPSAHRTLLLTDAAAPGAGVDGIVNTAIQPAASSGDTTGTAAYRTVTWIPGSTGACAGKDGVVAGTAEDAVRALRSGSPKHVLLRVWAEANQLPALLDTLFAVQSDHHESREVQAHAG